jgi:hypothetical protein
VVLVFAGVAGVVVVAVVDDGMKNISTTGIYSILIPFTHSASYDKVTL